MILVYEYRISHAIIGWNKGGAYGSPVSAYLIYIRDLNSTYSTIYDNN
jgi:hypothetical protein